MSWMKFGRSPRRFASRSAAKMVRAVAFEALESRELFAVQVTGSNLQTVFAKPSTPAANTIDLTTNFTNPAIPGTVVEMQTTMGNIDFSMTDSATPNTVANFLAYINSGAYDNTIFHRSANLNTNAGGSPSAPATIIQGGGYSVSGRKISHIATNAALNDEFTNETLKDVAGTIAMAKTSSANSATSEFFFNVSDNTTLDTPTTDSNGVSTSYTVFGKVINTASSKVITAIGSLPTTNLSSVNSALNTLPYQNVPANYTGALTPGDLVYTKRVLTFAGTTFTAVSDNPLLVQPTVHGNDLSFSYASGKTGVANITVTAKSFDGTTAVETIAVTVPDTTSSAGPAGVPDTYANVPAGSATSLKPLQNDTDAVSPFSPALTTISTLPVHGTATVDPATGYITYTPAAGFTGTDSLFYVAKDSANTATSATKISLTVVAAPVTTTIGTATARTITYTEPDGTVAHLAISNGTALVTFTGSDVTLTTAGRVVTATGTGATIADITVTNTTNRVASLVLTASGGTDKQATVGTINDVNSLNSIIAPTTKITGAINVGGLALLNVAATDHAMITIGNGRKQTSLTIGTASDTSVADASPIYVLRSKKWLDTDGLTDSISAPSIWAIVNTGDFADSLQVTSTGTAVKYAVIGGAVSSPWALDGAVGALSAKSAASTWSLTTTKAVGSLRFTGDLAGNVSAGSIGTVSVGGSLHDNSIKTSAAFSKSAFSLRTLRVAGAISNSSVITNGNIGLITGRSLTGSHIYAGISSAITTAGTLPTLRTDLSSAAVITGIRLIGANPAFADSEIAANTISVLRLGVIKATTTGSSPGVAARGIFSMTGTLDTGKKFALNKAALASATALSKFLTTKSISLTGFTLTILP